MNNREENPIGRAIRRRRQTLKITQSVLADISGVARHTISDLESGNGNPTLEVLRNLSVPLGLRLVLEIAEPSTNGREARP